MQAKKQICFLFLFISPFFIFGQKPRKNYEPDSVSNQLISELKGEFGANKRYPQPYEKQILLALSYYPELENTSIFFRVRKRHTPLDTRSTWLGLVRPQKKRHYVITISDSSESMLAPILFKNLPFNAQIRVIGHELGHVTDFSSMFTSQILKHAVRNVSAKYIDHFEFRTDSICIAHGLGYQLLAWSSFVRQKMHNDNWDGADNVHQPMERERYMNPSTIRKRIAENPIYH
ncbi:MAG TPA: hypothetical protein VGQ09_22980 [Chitinophagaceae bacterium]|jgi:hypothetical protein|nr:hypothetical protein [Chitinophagaceae bacterium]